MLILAASIILLNGCAKSGKAERLTASGGVVQIDAGQIPAGGLKFFSYLAGGKEVLFFVVRTEGGEYKAALDACETCYTNRMGYRAEPGCVVCGYCGNRFSFNTMDNGLGGCRPIKLVTRRDGGRLLIDERELQDGAKWF